MNESLPNVERGVSISFTFEEQHGYIELIFNKEQERPFNGWNIYPHKDPLVCRILC